MGLSPLCAQPCSMVVVALCLLGLVFTSVHGQPTLLLFVGPWLLSFSVLPCPKLFLQLLPLSGLGLWLAMPPSPGAEMAESPQDIDSKLKQTLITAD